VKAALFEAAHRLRVAQRSLRSLLPDEVLLRIQACGVCGTDIHIVEGSSRSTPPVVLGHEFVGVVEDIGSSVKNVTPGDVVAIDPNISCGACFYCRRGLVHLCEHLKAYGVDLDGGMAEQCIVKASQLYHLPAELPWEVGTFIEPVSCCVHGIDRASIRLGDTVVLLGAGTIGLILLQLARSAGAARVIVVEPREHKRIKAQELGASRVLDPTTDRISEAVKDVTGVGADVVFECAGTLETAQQSLRLVRRGGTVVFFGVCPRGRTIDVEPNFVFSNELAIVGSYINPHTFARAINLLHQGKIRLDKFFVERFPLDAVHEALASLRVGNTVKTVIVPNE